jgi:hypothetical protein
VTELVKGADLSRLFYTDVVRPIVLDVVGDAHSAAMIDYGSEILGFDDEMSKDHSWGPRLQVFLPEDTDKKLFDELDLALRARLPLEFMGYSTSFIIDDEGVRISSAGNEGQVDHFVLISTLSRFLSRSVGLASIEGMSDGDWLSLPSQKLLTLSTGPVFHDRVGILSLQSDLQFYPDRVWKYLMACQWMCLSQEEPFIGRTGMTGDDLGSRIIASRLVQHAIRLAFLIERRYAPYSKWFGTAFRNLSCGESLGSKIERVLSASDWQGREKAFVEVTSLLGELHNDLEITETVDISARYFHDRPFQVLGCERFMLALKSVSSDSKSAKLWGASPIGGIDTFSDSTDLLEDTDRRSKIAKLFD